MASPHEPIAIVGTACRFPGGSDSPSKLWELLREPRDLLTKVPSNRFDTKAYYHPDPTHHGTTNVQESYFLDEDPALFDNSFFNIQPTESESIDPQQRMLLETVYSSLCAAGIPVESLRGSPTAVFVGVMCDDWSGILSRDWENTPTYAATGMGRSIMSNRISYFFDWHGPSITLDTACSSSLVAVHQAIQTLLSGESRVAIAAGANLILSPAMYIAESKLRMLSPTGRSRMWDKDADGYARGEGIASVVLKTLSAAIEDGDHIECIIRGTGVNQDGRTTGLTMPSGTAQENLIRSTYARAGLDINDPKDRPQFFHAHGTGTPAGDPQEARAISHSFFSDETNYQNDKLYVGSLKTIIGHTEGTAGLASLIATSLAIQNATIPPNMHFNEISPLVAPFYQDLEIPTVAKAWPTVFPGQPRRASVNSFGFGGTNAHAILEAYEPVQSLVYPVPVFTPLVFSAACERSLKAAMVGYSNLLKSNPSINLRDLAWTLQRRSSTLSYRQAVAGINPQDFSNKIDLLVDDKVTKMDTRYFDVATPRILGVFTGQGAQWSRMGAQLIHKSPFANQIINKLDRSLAELPLRDRPSWTIKDELSADEAASRLSDAAISQPLCTALQIVLVDLLGLAGVKFHSVIGHSSGEIGAAYAAGLITATDAIRIAYYRGIHAKLAKSPNGTRGAMMAVGTTLEDANGFCELEHFAGRIQVAACNSLSSITLSGDEDAIDEAVGIFKDEQKFARKLKVDTAYHSTHMKACALPYLDSMTHCDIQVQDGNGVIWHSSVAPNGLRMTKENLHPQYWVDNMTQMVLFSSAAAMAVSESGPFDIAIEVGPHPALKGPFLANLDDDAHIPYTGLLSRNKDDVVELSSALGFIWTRFGSGAIDFDSFESGVSGCVSPKQMVVGLPNYPFDHQRSFWGVSRIAGAHGNNHAAPHPLLGRRIVESETSQEIQWRNILKPKEIGWLKCHKLQGQIVFPATAYVAMAIESMAILAGRKNIGLIAITPLTIGRAIAFNDENSAVESLFSIKLITDGPHELVADFACYSSLNSDPMGLNASGRIVFTLSDTVPDILPAVQSEQFNLVDVEIERFYDSLTQLGYEYSAPFRGVKQIKRKINYAMGNIEDASDSDWEDQLIVHPAMLDTAVQTIFAAHFCPGDGRLWSLHVPTHIDSLVINPRYTALGLGKQRNMAYQSVMRKGHDATTSGDVHILVDVGGQQQGFVQIEGVHLVPLSAPTPDNDAVLFSQFEYHVAEPNGDLAAGNDQPTQREIDMAIESDRISYFYLRRLVETITPTEKANAIPHFQKMLDWAEHVMAIVSRGEHPALSPDCQFDTYEQIQEMIGKYPERVDVRLIQAVGENLPAVIRGESSILEHMTKDGMLDNFYEDGLSLDTANRWLARMVTQLSHRYPHMNILEIGAGTGGSTRVLLPMLGSAFSSYTYTDISSAFFDPAQERFKDFTSRMIFKTFDMERSPDSQGFVEGSYDLILASNVLHATNKLEEMMTNVRKFLKPGGYAIIFETTSNDLLRVGLPMGGLPGWWIGAEDGRPWGPTMSLPKWDSLLRKCGFGGIEASTPPFHNLHPFSVFAAQATNDQISLLRNPFSTTLTQPLESLSPQLIVIGGKTFPVHRLVEEVALLLGGTHKNILRHESIEMLNSIPIPSGSTILCLTELDEPLLKTVTAAKLEALKVVWSQSHNILWVTRGSRAKEPHSYMMIGIGRAMSGEHPNINLQMVDIDSIQSSTARMVSEMLLRLEYIDAWNKDHSFTESMWSSEPEVVVENGLILIPRLYSHKQANGRYNTSRRPISDIVNPQDSQLLLMPSGSTVQLHSASPLRTANPLLSQQGSTRIQVTHSVLQYIHIASVGYMMLCSGKELTTGEPVVALSSSAESPAPALMTWTIPLGQTDPARALLTISASIVAREIAALAQPECTVWIHGSDSILLSALTHQAAKNNFRVFFTSSVKANCDKNCQYIDGNFSRRLIPNYIPSGCAVFVDVSGKSTSTGKLIAECLPTHCSTFNATHFFGTSVDIKPGFSSARVAEVLQLSAPDLKTAIIPEGSFHNNLIPLQEISIHSIIVEPLAVIDWSAASISAVLQPIDASDIFKSDKTYLLVGLSGEVGQSLCKWMVEHGARHVVLTSRRPKVDPEFIYSLKRLGADVRAIAMDITNRKSLTSCYSEICRTMPEIAGVANGAMVLQDSMFENMTIESMLKVLGPKVEGTKLLDELFHDVALDFFILFSSITAVGGNSGQSNYIAANMFMIALAHQRRKRGLAGSAIGISSLIGLGYVERSEDFDADYFTKIGYNNISEHDFHQLFAEAIVAGHPDSPHSAEVTTGLSPIYSDSTVNAKFRSDPKFSHFVLDRPGTQGYAGTTAVVPVRVRLLEVDDQKQAYAIIRESFIARLKRTLQISEEESVDERVSLVEQGVDSLMAVDVRSWFLKELDIDMPVLKVLGGGSVVSLLDDAMDRLPASFFKFDVGGGKVSAPVQKDTALSPPALSNGPSTETSSIINQSLSESPSGSATPPSSDSDKETITGSSHKRDIMVESSTEISEVISFGQTRFWFLNQYLKDPKSFNMAVKVRLSGPLQLHAMEKAVEVVCQRHEALRTRFFTSCDDEEIPSQGIISKSLVGLEVKTIYSESEADDELESMHDHIWDLGNWQSIRIRLLTLSDTVHYIIVGSHHITLDGFSFSNLFTDLEGAYSGRYLSPLPAKSQYRAFATQQRRDYEAGQMNAAIEYYRSTISNDMKPIPLFPFATTSTRQTLDAYSLHEAKVTLDPALASRIKALGRKCRVTAFHVYLAAFQAFLFRLLPEMDDLFIGIADANRTDKKFLGSLGFFLNLLPLKFEKGNLGGTKVSGALNDARNKAYTALEHSKLPFDVLLNELNISRSGSHTPIFQVFVDYRQVVQERKTFGGCETGDERWLNAKTGYDLSLEITDNPGDESLLVFRLQEALYSKESTELLLGSYISFLEEFSRSSETLIQELPLWPQKAIDDALEVGKGPRLELKWPATISHRIDDISILHAGDVALKDGYRSVLTYEQMRLRVNSVALCLQATGVTRGDVVVVFQQPTTDWICSMLAIFRVGATYVPLDLRNSIVRLTSTVSSVQPRLILTDRVTTLSVRSVGATDIAAINVSTIEDDNQELLTNTATPESAAVILFTSGSTGEPKGVVMNHSSIRAQSEAYSRAYSIPHAAQVVLQQSILSFDFSLDQIFAALANGGCLYVVPADKRGDPQEITNLMVKEKVTYTSATPSEYAMWFQHSADNLAQCTSWRYAFAGGEPLSQHLIQEVKNLALVDLRFFNNYGPCEITIASTKVEVMYNDARLEDPVSAGFMLPNYSVYIVDQDLKPVPIGVPGEIVIGGAGVADRYLNMVELTNEKFIANTFLPEKSWYAKNRWSTMYRTGDYGHLHSDGALYCRGRIAGDTQVKLRGFRVELGEVEAAILKSANGALSNAVVTLRGNDGERFLAAHVIFTTNYPEADRPQLLSTLRTTLPLPSYMHPSVYVPLASLPLTNHLKIDRRIMEKLPLPAIKKTIEATEKLSETEQKLSLLWQRLIVQDVDIVSESDFFNAGGNSLLLVKLQSQIRETFRTAPRLVDLMNASKLKEMAAIIISGKDRAAIDWDQETALPKSWLTAQHAQHDPRKASTENLTVILTGATGFIGRELLQLLIQDDRISTVYCIVRAADGHPTSLADNSLKISLLYGDISKSNMGLSPAKFDTLSSDVDVIMHCGANRSFWDSYDVLRDVNVNACKELARLASKRRIPLHFISSGSVQQYDDVKPPTDGSDGYVASKWAAEQVLRNASSSLSLPVRIHRPYGCRLNIKNDTEATAVLRGLKAIAHQLGTRPSFSGLSGSVDLIPTQTVVAELHASMLHLNNIPDVDIIRHGGNIHVSVSDFADEVEKDPEFKALGTMRALEWFGEAKKAGFSYFISSHYLVMKSESGELISKR